MIRHLSCSFRAENTRGSYEQGFAISANVEQPLFLFISGRLQINGIAFTMREGYQEEFVGVQAMDYEQGLERLKQEAKGTDWLAEFDLYEFRLRDNLSRERRYGTTEQIRAE